MTLSIFWRVLYWGWVASEILVGVATRTKRSSGNVRDRGSLVILWIVIAMSMTACSWIGETWPKNMFGGVHWLKTASAILMVAGLGTRWTAIVTLGNRSVRMWRYRIRRRSRGLDCIVSCGTRRTWDCCWCFLGSGCIPRNWIAFAAALVPTTAALLYRIHIEEAALSKAFGAEYAVYSRATKRLVPGLY